jgi:hypothetical protein
VFAYRLSEDVQLIGVSSYSMQAEDSDLKQLTSGALPYSGAHTHALIAGSEMGD